MILSQPVQPSKGCPAAYWSPHRSRDRDEEDEGPEDESEENEGIETKEERRAQKRIVKKANTQIQRR